MKQIFMVSFRGILGTGQIEDQNMMKGKCIDGKKIMSKFMSKLVKMIRDAIKEKSRERYKNLSQEEKHKIKESQRKMYQELVQYKKEALQNK